MTRRQDHGWQDLQQLWQSETVPADVDAAARQRVERERRRMVLAAATEAFVVLAVGAWSVHLLTTRPDPALIVTLLVFWTFAGVLVGFGILTRRGTWAPSAESTRAYLRLSVERAQRREQLGRQALKLMVVWTVAAVGLLGWSASGAVREGEPLLPLLRIAAPVLLLTFGLLGVFTEQARRRARTEITQLEDIIDAFSEMEASGSAEEDTGPDPGQAARRL
jgi:cation transport ATPase